MELSVRACTDGECVGRTSTKVLGSFISKVNSLSLRGTRGSTMIGASSRDVAVARWATLKIRAGRRDRRQ